MTTDAIVLLREDHKNARRLFRAYRETDTRARDADDRGELADRIVHELTVHTYLEDEVFYPQIRRQVPDLDAAMRLAHEEHHVAEVLCGEIAALDDSETALRDAKVEVLIEAVERHIEREEHDWFPMIRPALGRNELQRIGERMLAVRQTAPGQPERPSMLQRVADAMSR